MSTVDVYNISVKHLSAAMCKLMVFALGFVSFWLATCGVSYASDLEIYKTGGKGGQVTITLMLDTSGSMLFVDSWACYRNERYTRNLGKITLGYVDPDPTSPTSDPDIPSDRTIQIPFTKKGCWAWFTSNNNRLTELKIGIVNLIANPDPTTGGLSDDIIMGAGNFSLDGDGKAGVMVIPAKKLTHQHRLDLINYILDLSADGSTPTAHAYSEVGAYMMGTANDRIYDKKIRIIGKKNKRNKYYKCKNNSTSISWTYGTYGFDCEDFVRDTSAIESQAAGSLDAGREGTYYYEWTGPVGQNENSGFNFSSKDTKNKDNGKTYESPIVSMSTTSECDGNGIYFLTDGSPNDVTDSSSRTLMDRSLNLSDTGLSGVDCNGGLKEGSYFGSGWGCIGSYAKRLRDKSNPAKTEIKTAVVGYGAFYSVAETNADFYKIDPETNKKYTDCSLISDDDAWRACNWGAKTYGDDDDENNAGIKNTLKGVGGYGEGGFYYAADGEAVAASIVDFAQSLTGELKTSPSGIMTSPVDALDTSHYRAFGYLPIIEPKPGTANVIWPGNLKKYHVKNAALYSSQDDDNIDETTPVFDKFGTLNSTRDLWKATTGKDDRKVHVGGAFSKILSQSPTVIKDRKVYVNNAATLQSLSVDASDKLVGFDGLSSDALTNSHRRQLLNFMGYVVPVNSDNLPATLVDGSNNSLFDPNHKVLGGVIHSMPQMITYSASINESTGEFIDKDRKDYVLYGSMDGALHVLDDSSGVEALTFVPKEIVQSQGNAFVPGTIHADSQPVHGVDGPWTVYSELDFNEDGTKVTSDKVYAFGGLRMGGDHMYGLNLTNIDSPKLLFNLGRSKTTYDIKNGAETTLTTGFKNEANETAFARMGQSWSKPVVTRVWYKGKRQLVVIFAGGYDPAYENPYHKPTSATLGNAVYMVAAEDNDTVKAGDLLGWVSSSSGATKVVATMKYSIVGEPNVQDRNNDGLADHIYVADLGGQVFRIDLQNDTSVENGSVSIKRVVRLLDASADVASQGGKTDTAPRFYERPTVTFHNLNGLIQAVITAGSGDRSSPLHKRAKPNRLYAFVDRDVARVELYSDAYSIVSKDLSPSASGSKKLIGLPNKAAASSIKDDMTGNLIAGWYYELDEYNEIKADGVKSYNPALAINGDLLVTVYSPTGGGEVGSCQTGLAGETELRRYCLPYGICDGAKDVVSTTLIQGIGNLSLTRVNNSYSGILSTQGTGNIAEKCKPGEVCEPCTGENCPKDPLEFGDPNLDNPLLGVKGNLVSIRPKQWFERR